jgi:hypothetical protein
MPTATIDQELLRHLVNGNTSVAKLRQCLQKHIEREERRIRDQEELNRGRVKAADCLKGRRVKLRQVMATAVWTQHGMDNPWWDTDHTTLYRWPDLESEAIVHEISYEWSEPNAGQAFLAVQWPLEENQPPRSHVYKIPLTPENFERITILDD